MAKTMAEFTLMIEEATGKHYQYAVPLIRLDQRGYSPLQELLEPLGALGGLIGLIAIGLTRTQTPKPNDREWVNWRTKGQRVVLAVDLEQVDYLLRARFSRQWTTVESLPWAEVPISLQTRDDYELAELRVGDDMWYVSAWHERELKEAVARDNKRNPQLDEI